MMYTVIVQKNEKQTRNLNGIRVGYTDRKQFRPKYQRKHHGIKTKTVT